MERNVARKFATRQSTKVKANRRLPRHPKSPILEWKSSTRDVGVRAVRTFGKRWALLHNPAGDYFPDLQARLNYLGQQLPAASC